MQSPPFSGKVLNFKCINHWLFLCFSVSKNPSLHLKHTTIKNKKKIRKKNPVSPVKKIQSPLKNKFIGSPAKNMPATSGSPQKLIDGFLKQEGRAAQVLLTRTAFGKAVSASLDWVHVAIFLPWILHWHLSLYVYDVPIFVRLSITHFYVWNRQKQFHQLRILQAHQLCRRSSSRACSGRKPQTSLELWNSTMWRRCWKSGSQLSQVRDVTLGWSQRKLLWVGFLCFLYPSLLLLIFHSTLLEVFLLGSLGRTWFFLPVAAL